MTSMTLMLLSLPSHAVTLSDWPVTLSGWPVTQSGWPATRSDWPVTLDAVRTTNEIWEMKRWGEMEAMSEGGRDGGRDKEGEK